ncbi:DsbE family thiol:disulfide interchange protein [Beijerinckia sp. L45]|uniref:DsbE family thiol:disulfide interchange protein n=1 Tax=Beijerinckia sp. L45 TaxID=1641855 RepID=UPI00131B7986|nr:DsbE family thiol:disulfide interchange protein [Beijerinckia sp. L45]
MSDFEGVPAVEGRRRRSLFVFLPLVLFLGLAALFLLRLFAGDASRIPSALIDKPVPTFALGPVPGLAVPGLASAELKAGKVTVVNVFASWCVPCHQEHATLLLLQGAGVNLVGIAYKDEAENTRRFLGQDGNPYKAIGADTSGRTGIDFGVYGVPETYVVNGAGTITAKIVGPLSEEIVRDQLMPAIEKAKG